MTAADFSVDLYWLPLGAGDASGCVRWNGWAYEALVARREHREPRDLYHSALLVTLGAEQFAIEMAPVWGNPRGDRGVVLEGPVGSRLLGRSRFFRYEVRCWRAGRIPDVAAAVASPTCVTTSGDIAAHVLELVPQCPPVTWGRDELHAGEMWNSNSLVSWLLARAGCEGQLRPPPGGRAPGWDAGLVVARRMPRTAEAVTPSER